jgi:hypothetical protein
MPGGAAERHAALERLAVPAALAMTALRKALSPKVVETP